MSLSKNTPESYYRFPHDEGDSFEYHRMNPPDYSYRKKMPLWRIDEASHLIYGVEPGFYENLSEDGSIDNAEEEIKKTKRLLERDILAKKVKTYEKDFLNPTEVIYWAICHDINVPEELSYLFHEYRKKIDKSTSKNQELPYLNTEHKYHSEELAIAIETWMALFEDKQYISKKETINNPQFKSDIQKHIKKQHPKLSDRSMDRIGTLINPRKRGGAQSTY
jgi:hypothetical protein